MSSTLHLLVLLATVILANTGLVFACVSGSCVNGMCSDIPSNNEYYLTSFCDKSVACGSFSGNCNEWYSADYSRFGCNSLSKMAVNNAVDNFNQYSMFLLSSLLLQGVELREPEGHRRRAWMLCWRQRSQTSRGRFVQYLLALYWPYFLRWEKLPHIIFWFTSLVLTVPVKSTHYTLFLHMVCRLVW